MTGLLKRCWTYVIIRPAGLSWTLTTCIFWCLPSKVFTSRRQSLKWSSCCSSVQVFMASCGLLIPAWRTVARTFGTEAKRCKENIFVSLISIYKDWCWFLHLWPMIILSRKVFSLFARTNHISSSSLAESSSLLQKGTLWMLCTEKTSYITFVYFTFSLNYQEGIGSQVKALDWLF